MKISANSPCPCESGKKYKKCCQKYHKGAIASDAVALMKSRYTAFALGKIEYIIKTTHPDNSDFMEEKTEWRSSILNFTKNTDFLGLKIINTEEREGEAFVSFVATLSSGELREKSRFLRVAKQWLYIDGVMN